MKKQITLVLTILLLASFASADIYIKSKIHIDGMMGQPARDTVSEQWIGDNQFATVSDNSSTVIDLNKNVFYMINHKDKTFVEASLPFDFTKLLPPQAAGMMANMKMSAVVKATGGKKTVGQWACDEYEMTMNMMGMPMKSKIYASENVPFDAKAFMQKMASHMLKTQFMNDTDSIKEMMKIKGFMILQETNMEVMGNSMKTTNEVVEISKKAAPAGIYAVPAGFTKKPALSMGEMQK